MASLRGRWENGWLGDIANRSRPPVARQGSADAALASVETRIIDPGLPTVIAFGGLAHQLTMPVATFVRTLSSTPVNVLFVKDLRQCWYQRGLRGFARRPEQAASLLGECIPARSEVVGAVGTSAGGTGAIIFGALLGLPRIVAFAPRTLVDSAGIRANRAAGTPIPRVPRRRPYYDLAELLAVHPVPHVEIHVGGAHAHDMAQARRLEGIPGVTIREHPTDQHTVAAWLRDQGALEQVVLAGLGLAGE